MLMSIGLFIRLALVSADSSVVSRSSRQSNLTVILKTGDITGASTTSKLEMLIHFLVDSSEFFTLDTLSTYRGATEAANVLVDGGGVIVGVSVRILRPMVVVHETWLLEWVSDGCIGGWAGNECQTRVGCLGSTYGPKCKQTCHCQYMGHCDGVTGKCGGSCHRRFRGKYCNHTCPVLKYGDRCQGKCHCKYQHTCHVITGECLGGCEKSYAGPSCEIDCRVTYNDLCPRKCNCQQGTCNPITGTCSGGCDILHHGPDCQQTCPRGFYMNWRGSCRNLCHCAQIDKCRISTGVCETGGCLPGYIGKSCENECSNKTFGANCTMKCHCIHDRQCHIATGVCARGCALRYAGPSCQIKCLPGKFLKNGVCQGVCRCANPRHCRASDGSCTRSNSCQPGYIGSKCDIKCPRNRFGKNCSSICHCLEDECDHVTGRCSYGCDWRHTSPSCQHGCPVGRYLTGGPCLGECTCRIPQHCRVSDGLCMAGGCAVNRSCRRACKNQRFGPSCQNICHCMNNYRCDPQTGHCPTGCRPGYYGNDCQGVCSSGTFLVKRFCSGSCHCLKNGPCRTRDGLCLSGECQHGWSGASCQQKCSNKTFGINCRNRCRCNNDVACDPVSGACPMGLCHWRYHGHNCQKTCDSSRFGANCDGRCHCEERLHCRVTDGACLKGGCQKGWDGLNCQISCQNRFGPHCEAVCHCLDNEPCDRNTGACQYGCQWRFAGAACQETCPEGMYGPPDCQAKCRCKRNDTCHVIHGFCTDGQCLTRRYTGPFCTQSCRPGQFLIKGVCAGKCHCKESDECSVVNGECSGHGCLPGWLAKDCQKRCQGTFGPNCSNQCHCKNDEMCDHVSGHCESGCDRGYEGLACQYPEQSEEGGIFRSITTWGAMALGAAIILPVLSALVAKRRRLEPAERYQHCDIVDLYESGDNISKLETIRKNLRKNNALNPDLNDKERENLNDSHDVYGDLGMGEESRIIVAEISEQSQKKISKIKRSKTHRMPALKVVKNVSAEDSENNAVRVVTSPESHSTPSLRICDCPESQKLKHEDFQNAEVNMLSPSPCCSIKTENCSSMEPFESCRDTPQGSLLTTTDNQEKVTVTDLSQKGESDMKFQNISKRNALNSVKETSHAIPSGSDPKRKKNSINGDTVADLKGQSFHLATRQLENAVVNPPCSQRRKTVKGRVTKTKTSGSLNKNATSSSDKHCDVVEGAKSHLSSEPVKKHMHSINGLQTKQNLETFATGTAKSPNSTNNHSHLRKSKKSPTLVLEDRESTEGRAVHNECSKEL